MRWQEVGREIEGRSGEEEEEEKPARPYMRGAV